MSHSSSITITAPANPHTVKLSGHSANRPARVPIIFILIDETGPDQFESYSSIHSEMGIGSAWTNPGRALGRGVARTPVINQLAAEGVTFTNCYTPPVCSSTRWGTLCGQYPRRTHIGAAVAANRVGPNGEKEAGDRRSEITIHRMLPADYDSIQAGKLHLKLRSNEGAGSVELAGINALLGCTESRLLFRNLNQAGEPADVPSHPAGYRNYTLYTNEVGTDFSAVHATTKIRQQAQAWLNNVASPLSFSWVAFNACHSPMVEGFNSGLFPEDPASNLPTASGYSGTAYGTGPADGSIDAWDASRAGLEMLDYQLGLMRDSLNTNSDGLWDRAWVIVAGDNGTQDFVLDAALASVDGGDIAAPYLDFVIPNDYSKGSVRRAGTRVPFIVKGPEVRSPGRTCGAMVDLIDLWAFVREVTQQSQASVIPDSRIVDAISFMPLLRDPNAETTSTRIRQWSRAERFQPMGDPTLLVSGSSTPQPEPYNAPGTVSVHEWSRATRGKASDGVNYCLLTEFDGAGGTDESLFNLDSNPYETGASLPLSGVGYTEAKAAQDAVEGLDP